MRGELSDETDRLAARPGQTPSRGRMRGIKTRPWVMGPALSQRRVAIVSSAGLVVRGEDPFRGRDPHYHAIPATTRPEDLLWSHISINFDRTGLQEDWNVAFPIDRLRELAAEGTIGSVAATHYSFMGATDPREMEGAARGGAAARR